MNIGENVGPFLESLKPWHTGHPPAVHTREAGPSAHREPVFEKTPHEKRRHALRFPSRLALGHLPWNLCFPAYTVNHKGGRAWGRWLPSCSYLHLCPAFPGPALPDLPHWHDLLLSLNRMLRQIQWISCLPHKKIPLGSKQTWCLKEEKNCEWKPVAQTIQFLFPLPGLF